MKVAVIAIFMSMMPLTAQAKGLFIINTGDELFDIGSDPRITESLGDRWKLGYKCSHLGVMWADIWTWDCKIAAVNTLQDSYTDLPNEIKTELSTKYSMSNAIRGSWNHYGFLAMLASLAAFAYIRRPA
jgi:hypothetical protein